MVAHLGIIYTRLEEGCWRRRCRWMRARISRLACCTRRFAALAETLGSMAGWLMTEEGQCVVGTELNASHHRAVSSGKVRGECRPLHLGRQSQSWDCGV
jgi:uncharacterized protein (TIGR00369 family)